jgi:hypothetical protein
LPSELAQRDVERAGDATPSILPGLTDIHQANSAVAQEFVELFDAYLGRGPARERLHHLL